MPARPAVITVNEVEKTFQIPHHRPSTLKERALHPFRRIPSTTLRAAHGISFEVGEGEFFGVLGRNGSGKSTLLKMIAGIYQPDSGEIDVRGPLSPFIDLGVGFNAELAARDNVMINGTMLGLSRSEAKDRFDEVIAFAELEEFEGLKLKNYSSGMLVRLAFAAALQIPSATLLLDEVLAVGDVRFQRKCFQTFQRLRDEGRTIVLVTHSLEAVRQLCDRALLLERGAIAAIGGPDEVTDSYRSLLGLPEEGVGGPGREAIFEPTAPDVEPTALDAKASASLEEVIAEHQSVAQASADGSAEIARVWIENGDGPRPTVHPGERLTIRAEVAFRDRARNPSFAFQIWDAGARPVLFSHSDLKGVRAGNFEAGERMGIALSLDNCLGAGSYIVSLAVAKGRGEFAAVAPTPLSFEVTGGSGALLDPPHELEVERL